MSGPAGGPPFTASHPDPSEQTTRRLDALKDDLRREFDHKLEALAKVTEEKFDGLHEQLLERSKRTDQQIAAGILERNDRIQSLKDLVGLQNEANKAANFKTEQAMAKDIDSIREVSRLDRDTITNQITSLSNRLITIETSDRAVRESRSEGRLNIGTVAAIIAGIVGLIAIFSATSPGIFGRTPINPTVGADTKRVDDLIAMLQNRDREIANRFESLSNRLNNVSAYPAPTQVPTNPLLPNGNSHQ